MNEYDRRPRPASRRASLDEAVLLEPGKRTPAQGLRHGPVQRAIAIEGADGTARGAVPSDGGGSPMPVDVRAKMERSFGADFSSVKIHEGPSSAALGARAYTQGSDIHFAPGQYQPGSEAGQALLGHELAHVVQQAHGRVGETMQAKGVGVNDDATLEREADELGARAARGEVHDGAPAALAPAATGVVQRFIWLAIDDENFISTKQDEGRPPGCLPGGSQGDHTTPFTSLQDQIANAIEGVTLADAWVNLQATLAVYQTLPGWAESKAFTTGAVATHVQGLITAKGDINALQIAVTQLLTLRNQIALTSLPKGGPGNGEGKWAGGLQFRERQFQLGHNAPPHINLVLDYMWKAFAHARVENQGPAKAAAIHQQHAISMADAYPQLCGALGINAAAILAHFGTQVDWVNYQPPE